jgi:ABC-2 type transport system ATP-binding protein
VIEPQPLMRALGVARSFHGRVALAPLDLELRPGETVALVGPNGAGKSTLLALLAGALAPSAGAVAWAPGVRAGWVPQRPAHYGRLSALENLELFARLGGEPREAAGRLLRRFDLPDEQRPVAELSVGNRQRLNLALAFLGDPRVLLLDEPTASLDPGQRARLWRAVAELRAAGGAALFATQNLEELDRVADRVEVLRGGERIFAGEARDWKSRGDAYR